MKWFVWWSTDEYAGDTLDVFDAEEDVVKHLNEYAGNSDFKFRVVNGKEVKFKPVEVAILFERTTIRSD